MFKEETSRGGSLGQNDKDQTKVKLVAGIVILIASVCIAVVIASVIIVNRPNNKENGGNHGSSEGIISHILTLKRAYKTLSKKRVYPNPNLCHTIKQNLGKIKIKWFKMYLF